MPSIPMCQPDGQKIHELIEARGYTVAEFARKIGRPSVRSVWRAIAGEPVRVAHIRLIARGLSTPRRRVKPSVISDWTGDDDLYDEEPEPEALASLDAKNGPPRERGASGITAQTVPNDTKG